MDNHADSHAIEGFRLSPQQQAVFDGGDPATMVAQVCVLLEGSLDHDRLVAALREVVGRHEILRTRFQRLAAMRVALQVIAGEPLVDVELRAAVAGPHDLDAILAEARREPFDLARGARLRCELVPLGVDRRLLVVTAPSLCLDARSLDLLVRELGERYAHGPQVGAALGEPDAERLQYVQFSEWQNQIEDEEDAGKAAAFWQHYLAGDQPALRLPLEQAPSEPEAGPRGPRQTIDVAIGPVATAGIEAWLAGRGVGADGYFLACWLVFLARATGCDQLETQVCRGGRTLDELDEALGLFCTSVPFRLALDLAATGARLLDTVAFHLRDVDAFQSFGPRDRAARAAVHTAFEYTEAPAAGEHLGVRFSVVARRWSTDDRLALKLVVERRGAPGPGAAAYGCRLEYDPARIAEPAAATFARALQHLCEALAARPDAPVGRLAMMSVDDQRHVVRTLGSGRPADRGRLPAATFVAGFAACAARWPERIAYTYDGTATTYRALDRRASQVARALLARGVRPGTLVALVLDRGPHTLAGLVGILKAGAAFLPLDLRQPERRVQAILHDARPVAAVTRQGLCESLPAGLGDPVLVDGAELDAMPHGDPGVRIDPASPAYVLYTSGSTGTPKGVVIRHDAVMNLARALDAEVYGNPDRPLCVSLNASLTFDSSVKQWTRLAAGDTLLGIPEDLRTSGEALRGYLETHGCQVLDGTPSQFELVLGVGLPAGLERVLLGGEAIAPRLWQALLDLERATGCQFFNVYGPTECTVNAAWTRITERPRARDGSITPVIGRPIPGCHVAIHDPHGNPVPPGFTGELWIGGAGVATGYLRDPGRTADRFVPDPYGHAPGARMYRSGDRVRVLPDGAIEFLGRLDDQVKLRGLRIELGEIEAAVKRHPGVKDCAVVLREDRPGDRRLVGYVVAHHAEAAGYRLPNGMVVAHQNMNETKYLYDEIFNKQTYSLYGIHLPDHAVVFDVGANIGMYSLYVLQHCRAPRIFAFEPIAPIASALAHNLTLHGGDVTVLPHGLGDRETSLDFTYYPYYSMMSGASAYARPEQEVEVVRRYLEREAEASTDQARELLRHADDLLRFRFEGQTQRCRLRRLTDVIREHGVTHIDVLKIDVQRAELDVLRGLGDGDWARIDQIVMEVHQDPDGDSAHRVAEISALLEPHGFAVIAEQDPLLAGTDRYNLYASRLGLGERAEGRGPVPPARSVVVGHAGQLAGGDLQRHAAAWLPDHMIPSTFVMLDALPLSRHGKVDRLALPAPDPDLRTRTAPRTAHEAALLAIWAEVLGSSHIGVEDNFFQLGGHSLLATQVMAHIRTQFRVELPLRLMFEAPTVAELARRLDVQVAEAGSGDLATATATAIATGTGTGTETATAPEPAPEIDRAPRDRPLPLSFAQRRLWILDRMDPGSPAYNNPKAVRIPGELDVAALARALNELVRRHEPLRTRFGTGGDGEPVQVIEPYQAIALAPVDLSALAAPADAEAEAHRLAEREAAHRFDLAAGPLVRFQLIRLAARDHVLLFTMHHIITDAQSLDILWREAGVLYEAFAAGRPSPLPEPALQYADHAVWQHRRLTARSLADQLTYWRAQLAGVPAIELACDRPRPALDTTAGRDHRFRIDRATTLALRGVARAHDVTVFIALLAAYAAFLGRICRQHDIAIGTAVSGRAQHHTADMVGFFINTLVMRCDLSGEPSFAELIARAREVALSAHAHQDVPFEKLVEELAPARDTSRSPLFQVALNYQEVKQLAGEPGGARFDIATSVAKFDLSLNALHHPGSELALAFEYKTALFDPGSVAWMARQFCALVAAMVASPGAPVHALASSDEADRALTAAWNATGVELGQPGCAHELIAAQAARTPDQIAVMFDDQRLTYRELVARVNRLAHHLRGMGAGPDVVVAVLLERSVDLVVAVLGILAAGGAYVPLDPEYPDDRLAFVVRDLGAPVLVTCRALAGRLTGDLARVLCLDTDGPAIATAPATAPDTGCAADNLAYVMYTSGSTGTPKGVMVSHRGLVNYLQYSAKRYLTAEGGAPVHSSIGFDLTITSLLTPLAAGQPIVMIPPAQHVEGLAIALRGHPRFGLVKLTPSHLRLLEQQLAPGDVAGKVGAMVIGGEALSVEALRFWHQHAPTTRLINEYGPTETVVGCCVHQVTCDDLAAGTVPIGRPIWNTQLHVLGSDLRPVPVGMPGELCIAGIQLARGYLGRAALTAERFVPDPMSSVAGARMYRTGDLARYRPGSDGVLEFLGRIDLQVKLRGFRIEPGEIEAALVRHDQVRDAVVIVRDDRLAAYVVPASPDAAPTAAALRDHLRRQLPAYMVPSWFSMLDSLPLTTSGKIDRQALPAPVARRDPRNVQPRYALEWQVWAEMSEVLHTDGLGVTDDFFELGGHSLAAVTLANRLSERCGRAVPLAAIFHHPTVEGLADLLARDDTSAAYISSPLIELQPGAGKPPVFWVHPVLGTAFCYAALARALGPDQPFYALQAPGLEPGTTPISRMDTLVSLYADLVQSRCPHGRIRLGGWSLGGVIAFELARRLVALGRELAPVVVIDAFVNPEPSLPVTTAELTRGFLQVLGVSPEALGLAPDGAWGVEEMLEAVVTRARAAGVIPESAGRDQVRRYFEVYSANIGARRDYQAGPYDGEVVLLHWDQASHDKLATWHRLTGGRVHAIPIAGKHELLMSPPYVHEIAARLIALDWIA